MTNKTRIILWEPIKNKNNVLEKLIFLVFFGINSIIFSLKYVVFIIKFLNRKLYCVLHSQVKTKIK